MKAKTIFSVISLAVFISLTCWIIFYPSFHSKRKSLNGEVSIVWKTTPPRAYWIIEVQEDNKIRRVRDLIINDIVTIEKGDSIRKKQGSEEFYIKKKQQNSWVLFEEKGLVYD